MNESRSAPMLSDRNPDASGLVERDLAVFWHPCSQMRDFEDLPPLEVTAARGARLLLADGRQVLDAISSWWCKSLGHGHPGVRARIEQQLARFEHVIAANTTHHGLVELCERLLDIANGQPPSPIARRAGHFGKVFLADNGSTAVEIAMKMALQAQLQRGHAGRTGFASLAGGYHGETLATLSVGDLGLYSDPYQPLMFPVTKLGPIPYRTGVQDPRWQDAGPEWPEIERCLRSVADSLAAIVYEPVLQAAGGMRIYSPDLLRRLRRFADANGIFLIADEIAAGMGRLGTMLASELALISTDLEAAPAKLIERYADRWPTEVAYEEGKEQFGIGEARNRTEKAVQRTVPFQFLAMTLTITWYAFQEDGGSYGIFDTFETESARQAHLDGPIAKALMAKASELLSEAPAIHKIRLLAAKIPK